MDIGMEHTVERQPVQEAERSQYGICSKTKPFQREVNRRKIFKWCYRHATYGKFFGWIVAGSSVITFFMCLSDGSDPTPIEWLALILAFAALTVGGYYLCRLLAGIHGYLSLQIRNEITHEFDETLPRPIELAYRMAKYKYYIPAWNEVSQITSHTKMLGDETTKTTYASYIEFQNSGVSSLDVQYLEKGIAMPSVLKSLGIDAFRYDMIIAACKRMADDYEH